MTKKSTSDSKISRPRGRPRKDVYNKGNFSEEIPDDVERLLKKNLLVTYFVDESPALIKKTSPSKQEIADFWKKATDKISAYIIGEEICPTTKRLHFHAVFTAETQFSFRGIDKITIPGYTRPHVRNILRGEENLKRAINYCGKEDTEPLLLNYQRPTPRFSFSQSRKELTRTLSFYHEDPSEMSVTDTHTIADQLNIPLYMVPRFKNLVRQLKDTTKNPCYKDGLGDRTAFNVPKVIDLWMEHLKSRKVGLVIRAFDPDSVYDLISSFGPHILHDGVVNFEQFELEYPIEDATFRVMKGIPLFNAKVYGGVDHSTYLEPLLRGSGEFTYKDKILCNNLPVIFIEKTTSSEGFWDMYGSYLSGCMSIEILGFSKFDNSVSFKNPEVINELNEDEDIDCLRDSCQEVDDYVVVRYAPRFCRKTFGIEVDERMGLKKKPRSLNRYNYTATGEDFEHGIRGIS